jgi:hypothetical protein
MDIFKSLQKFVIFVYRTLMMGVLLTIAIGVLAYLFLLVFYVVNKNWAAPIVLSPAQEKVLAFQPQVAALESMLLKNKVDLATTIQKYKVFNDQISELEFIIAKFDTAVNSESSGLSKAKADIHDVLQQKRNDTWEMEKNASSARSLRASIDRELASGLITKDEAIARRLTVQSSLNAVTDSKINQIALQEQARLAGNASGTLGESSATSLTALQSLNNIAQLKILHAHAVIDAETAKQSIEQLRASVAESERILEIAKQSPYYLAFNNTVFVAFVQYGNFYYVKPGAPVYDCLLQVILCRKVGTVTQVYDAEEYTRHPLFRTDIKGKFVGITFDAEKYGESYVVFIGRKPLLL